jgi:hypothetical protein
MGKFLFSFFLRRSLFVIICKEFDGPAALYYHTPLAA